MYKVKCKNCSSLEVRVGSLDFARTKMEGQPASKYNGPNYDFYCHGCESQWQTGPESWVLYYEYRNLASQNKMTASTMSNDGSYGPANNSVPASWNRQTEIAKLLVASYYGLIVLSPSEWAEIEEDAKG